MPWVLITSTKCYNWFVLIILAAVINTFFLLSLIVNFQTHYLHRSVFTAYGTSHWKRICRSRWHSIALILFVYLNTCITIIIIINSTVVVNFRFIVLCNSQVYTENACCCKFTIKSTSDTLSLLNYFTILPTSHSFVDRSSSIITTRCKKQCT